MKRLKRIVFALLSILLVVLLAVGGRLFIQHHQKNAVRTQLVDASLAYDSIFLSMFPIENFHEEDFKTYEGLTLLKPAYIAKDYTTILSFLDSAKASGRDLKLIYLGLDPAKISVSEVQSLVDAFPETNYKIFLEHHPLSFWKEAKNSDELFSAYLDVTQALSLIPHVKVYPFFAQEWVIANEKNYVKGSELAEDIAQRVYLYALFSEENRDCHVRPDDVYALFSGFETLIAGAKNGLYAFPVLSEYRIVFLGDSVIGNFTDRRSIPRMVSDLSGAVTYNCGWGGATACHDSPMPYNNLVDVTNALLSEDFSAFPDNVQSYKGFTELFAAETAESLNSEETIFALHFGINDYIQGLPIGDLSSTDVNTYCGAMRYGIEKIREAFPKATLLIMVPNHIILFQGGTEIQGASGSDYESYVNALIAIAEKYGLQYLDDYHKTIVYEKSYIHLDDGIHPNDYGRFQIAYALMRLIGGE